MTEVKQIENINLKLGDIINIKASNLDLHDKHFFISYIDNDEIYLLDLDDDKKHILNIVNSKLTDLSIEEIVLLSRSDKSGFARQNDLIPGKSISIEFEGDIPTILNGTITNLDEDQIEMKLYPSNEVIYIDFAYKGIPKNLPIKYIKAFVVPDPEKLSELDLTPSPEKLLTPIEESEERAEQYVEQAEDKVEHAEELIHEVEDQLEKQRTAILGDADIVFGEELDAITQLVEVDESEKRFALSVQTTDILNELLSTIPTHKRTKYVINKIHMEIERYKQLLDKFSGVDITGNLDILKSKSADYKPLVESLKVLNKNLKWLIPVARQKKKLYDFDIDEDEDDDQDIEHTTLAYQQDKIYNLFNQYKSNSLESDNSYDYLINVLSELQTPFINTTNLSNLIQNIRVNSNQDVIINNNDDFQANVACGNVKDDITSINKAKPISIEDTKFLLVNYNTGLSKLQKNDKLNSDKTQKRIPLTNSDTINLLGFISLPKLIHLSNINSAVSNIYQKSVLNSVSLIYSLLLNNKTIINNISVNNETNFDFSKETYYSYAEILHFTDRTNEDYIKFLTNFLPKTSVVFENYKSEIENNVSFTDIIDSLQAFLIESDTITFKTYENIVRFMNDNILELKKNLLLNNNSYRKYIVNDYKFNIGKKNSYLFNILESPILLKENSTSTEILADYGIDNASTAELIRTILKVDTGKLFISALALEDIELFVGYDIDVIINTELEKLNGESKEDQDVWETECKNFTLAKFYLDIDDLREDNGNPNIVFDDKYDETRYDIIDEFEEQKDSMSPDAFNNFLIEHLINDVGLTTDEARKEARAMITKKRLVEKEDFAFIVNENNENIYFKRDDNNTWIHIPDLDNLPINKALFCNLKKSCFEIKKNCGDIIINKVKIKKNLIEQMVAQFDNDIKLSREDLLEKFTNQLRYNKTSIKKYVIMNNLKLKKYDLIKYQIGQLIEDRVIQASPYANIRNLILSNTDFIAKQNDILKFIEKFCRPADTKVEDKYWFYCIETNIKLLPTYFESLALAFFNKNYEEILEKITAERGILSDDGDKIVDKYSGYFIKNLELDIAEGYDEAGFKIVSRTLLEKDIKDVILDNVFIKPTETLRSKNGEMIKNVIITLNKQM